MKGSENKLLLTGGTGFLGSNLLRRLISDRREVILLKRRTSLTTRIDGLLPSVTALNIEDVELEKVFSDHKIETVIHCATDYGRKNVEPTQLIEANLILPLKLIQLASKYGTKTFVSTDTILDKGVSQYSLSKKQFLDWLHAFSNRLTCINVALEHFYGPGDNPTKFVSNMIGLILDQVPVIDLTAGEQMRDFIHIDDVVSAFMLILKESENLGCGFSSFEVGTGENISIHDLVVMIRELSGNTQTHLNFGALPYRSNEMMESRVKLENLKRLSWRSMTSVRDGLRSVIEMEKERLKK